PLTLSLPSLPFPPPPPPALHPLSLHDALPICSSTRSRRRCSAPRSSPKVASELELVVADDPVREVGERLAAAARAGGHIVLTGRSEEHTSELQSRFDLVCRLLLEKKNKHTLTPLAPHDKNLLLIPAITSIS